MHTTDKKEYLSSEAIKNIKKVKDQDELKKILESAGKECVDAYNKILLEVTVDEMGKAGNLFAQFIESIGVDSQNVVLCCGNHDRIRFIGDDSFNCRKEKEPVDDKKSFEAYDKLCGIINKRLSHTTTEYSCGNINFVIANSNWKLPEHGETNKMCVDCKHLCETLRGLKHSGDLNICNNIFIAHKPYAVQSIFFEPINERPTTDADINIRICWEIKVIQREYRYYTLYNELEFSEERRAEFEDDFEEPDTEICREIRKHLIKDNPAYINVMKNRETP